MKEKTTKKLYLIVKEEIVSDEWMEAITHIYAVTDTLEKAKVLAKLLEDEEIKYPDDEEISIYEVPFLI